jgi:hypothetical protein
MPHRSGGAERKCDLRIPKPPLEVEFDYQNGDDTLLNAVRETSSAAC